MDISRCVQAIRPHPVSLWRDCCGPTGVMGICPNIEVDVRFPNTVSSLRSIRWLTIYTGQLYVQEGPRIVRTLHLKSALISCLLIICLITSGMYYVQTRENQAFYHMVPQLFAQKNQGHAFQLAAFQHPDVLPLYGSSELTIALWYQKAYWASKFFEAAPTGFRVSPIGKPQAASLTMLLKLAAMGSELRGKKVVISLSPSWFFDYAMLPPSDYAGNFSRLQADELVFDTNLSLELKRSIAQRMLDYPATLKDDRLLRFALTQLSNRSPTGRLLYNAILPLGKLETLVLRLQDHWEMLQYIKKLQHPDQAAPSKPQSIDWPKIERQAEEHYRNHNKNNPFGFDDSLWHDWVKDLAARTRNSRSDTEFYQGLRNAKEWIDLDLLLRTLQELGAHPLVLSIPLTGRYYTAEGVSAQARQAYYQTLRSVVQPYGFPLKDFADHEDDSNFLIDPNGHLSAKGWAYYDQAIDNFYHGKAP